ncbi:YcxB family protein [Wohlfahrtiimonas chitiniclastica]|uniref:YcxB family protein n=1 Tax=Wohlfahrtiimonas chitiniclastica TaxID=400946 RepID=UPI001BD07A0A|nr:YcxB family protein [Wohlfahrtiimonas chitiniclastica]MBS7838366.1 YcxB family protein [Wohlfahrtiimonas chitiniclastica]
MEIEVTYIATLEEYYAADEGFRATLKKGSVDLYVQLALIIIAVAFAVIGQYFLGGVIAIVAFLIHQGYVKRWIVRRNFNHIANAGIAETLVFSDNHIVYKCGQVDEVIPWDDYAAYLETEQLLMLFYDSSDHYAIVPKRTLDEASLGNLRGLLSRKLANYGEYNV